MAASRGRRGRRGGRRLAVALAAAGLLAGPACAPGTAGTGADTVTIACGATEEWCQAMTRAFTAQTGITAEFVRLSSGEALARIKASRTATEFDVWHGGPADGYAAAAELGLLERYVSPNAAAIPARYKDRAGHWTGVYMGVLGFCSNTEVLGERRLAVPRSWRSLLDPALRRNIGMAHPATSGTAYTVLWTQVVLHGGADGALAYFTRLHPNVLQYSKSGSAPVQQVARGEIGVGVVFSHDCVAAREQGFPHLRVTFPAEGTGYEVGGVALVKGAPHPQAARRYIDWALTAAAQEVGPTAHAYQAPTHPDAKVSDRTVDLKRVPLIDYDVAAAGAAKPELTRRFDAEVARASRS